jgi:hypothetical protein
MRASLVKLSLFTLVSGSVGCGTQDKPEPKKIEQTSPFARDVRPPPPDPNDPLRNPAREAPRGPDGPQIPEADIEAALAEAAQSAAAGNLVQQRLALSRCANKTPADPRCDAELGLTMVDSKSRRAAGIYYLLAAAKVDHPKADAALYRRIGEALRQHGHNVEAVAALELAVAREPSGEHLFLLGQALSLVPDRLLEAADRMAVARSKDDRIAWLHDEAVLRGQIPAREQAMAAAALLRLYAERAASLPADQLPSSIERIEPRITELEALAKNYPTQAEYEAQHAAAKSAASALPEPTPPPPPLDPVAPQPQPFENKTGPS